LGPEYQQYSGDKRPFNTKIHPKTYTDRLGNRKRLMHTKREAGG